MPDHSHFHDKPWQVTIDYLPQVDRFLLSVRNHAHGSIAFSNEAAEVCGGAVEVDDDGYTTRCRHEPFIAESAREIARMSALSN